MKPVQTKGKTRKSAAPTDMQYPTETKGYAPVGSGGKPQATKPCPTSLQEKKTSSGGIFDKPATTDETPKAIEKTSPKRSAKSSKGGY